MKLHMKSLVSFKLCAFLNFSYLRYLSALSVIAVQDTILSWHSFLLNLLKLCAVLSVIRLQSSRFSTSIFLQLSANVL